MVRATKTTDAKTATAAAPAVKETASKAPRVKKTKPVVETAAPVATVPVVAADAQVDAAEDLSVATKMTEFSAKLQQLVGVFSTIKNDFKTLEKAVSREIKAAQKASSKKRRTNGNRQPSGFLKPTPISDELAEFFGKTAGTEMARNVVSKEINLYIKANNLKDPVNGRNINPDTKLSKLLKINKGDELSYFNLQKYLKHHFIKQTAVASV
jgi:hypothetical protein